MNLVTTFNPGQELLRTHIEKMNKQGYRLIQTTFDHDGEPIYFFWEQLPAQLEVV